MAEVGVPSSAPVRAPVPQQAPSARRTALQAPITAATCAIAATALVATVDPGIPDHYPVCPLLAFTGLFCPLCGGLRSVHALAHFDAPSSVAYNALTIPLLLLAVIFWAVWLRRAWRAAPPHPIAPQWAVWLVCVVGLAFGVARNLAPFARLAPPT